MQRAPFHETTRHPNRNVEIDSIQRIKLRRGSTRFKRPQNCVRKSAFETMCGNVSFTRRKPRSWTALLFPILITLNIHLFFPSGHLYNQIRVLKSLKTKRGSWHSKGSKWYIRQKGIALKCTMPFVEQGTCSFLEPKGHWSEVKKDRKGWRPMGWDGDQKWLSV